MAGVKGRSGRRPRSIEQKRLDIIDNAWKVVGSFLNSNAPIDKRVDVAIKVAIKDMPADMVLDQSEHTHYVLKWKDDGKVDRKDDSNRLRTTPTSDGSTQRQD